MTGHGSNPRIDPLLVPFLRTADEQEAQQQLEQLVAHAAPIIERVTRSGRTPEDAFQEATQRLIKQLWNLRADPNGNGIGNYAHYVSVAASHVIKGQLREEHPKRRRLVDGLRHALRRNASFALWEGESNERLCGLAEWRHHLNAPRGERLTRLLDDPRSFNQLPLLGREAASAGHADLLAQLFDWVGHPIRFNDLVKIFCELKGIEDHAPVTDGDGEGRSLSEWLPDGGWRPDEQAEWTEFLGRLWEQIERLPRLQRVAYLLNFTAADGEVELFWVYGVATIRSIGATLQLTEEEFARAWLELALNEITLESYDEKFALLWQHLPLTDATIAKMLGTERQKVINLRKAAADRLSRRLSGRGSDS